MTPEQIAKDLMSGMATENQEETKGEDKEKSDIPPDGVLDSDNKVSTSDPQPTDTTDPGGTPLEPSNEAESSADQGASGDDNRPLDLDEVQNVSADAFKEAYDYYKTNAVGDPKTREEHLLKLRNELAEYQEGENGTKNVTRGLLKNFTDENYSNALAAGQNIVDATLKQLSEVTYPDFDAFKVAREKAAADVHGKLQKNVAYPELSERLLKGLEDLSTKMQLKFNVSAAEKQKEQLLTAKAKKNIEQQKKSVELKKTLINSQQLKTNVEQERRLLAEQNEKQYREWKARMDLESKLREQQIVADLQAGFDDRANRLRTEFAGSQNQTMQMMMQMQRESLESQAKLTQFIMTQKQQAPPPTEVRQPPGLLTSILSPVTDLVGGLLGKLL
jgi:hypothetical protein